MLGRFLKVKSSFPLLRKFLTAFEVYPKFNLVFFDDISPGGYSNWNVILAIHI